MHKRDSFYEKYKKHRRPIDRHAFIEARHTAKQKLKQAHNRYIEEILGLTNPDGKTTQVINPILIIAVIPMLQKKTVLSSKKFQEGLKRHCTP